MKTSIFLCTWFLTAILVRGQSPVIEQIKTEPVTVSTGFSFKFHSTVLNEDRTIFISLPDGYDNQKKKYPVLYMIDGQWNFNHTSQTMSWLSRCFSNTVPHTIVVGIHTGENRFRDLTPTLDKNYNSSGGADLFYKFLKDELMPFVENNYSTYNYRILGGVSLGGLFVIHAFTLNPGFFNGYLALSPSMWWDNHVMLNKVEAFLSGKPSMNKRLYLALANEGQLMGVDSLSKILSKYSPKELIWKFDSYPEEVHETVNYKGLYDGMKFLYSDWYYPFVNFGSKEYGTDKISNGNLGANISLSSEMLDRNSDLYQDSYGRILSFTKADTGILFSVDKLPVITLLPINETEYKVEDSDVQNKLFLKNITIKFEFIKDDSLVVTANGKIECTAKRILHPPFVKLADNFLDKYVGTYIPLTQGDKLVIIKEGHILKLSAGNFITDLYPIAEQKFFVLANGSKLELEFSNDEPGKETKMIISEGGKLLVEAVQKTN